MDLGLSGRRAIITGGSRGLGRAIALALADEGCDVAICARDEASLRSTLAELEGRSIVAYGEPVDVTNPDQLHAFIDAAAEQLGGLDILVACAGGQSGGPKIDGIDADGWRTTLDLNVTHPALATRAAKPWMERGGGGSILFISSIAGIHPWTRSHYAAAKAGEINLAGSLARELGVSGIRVNVISPGSVTFPGAIWEGIREGDEAGFEEWLRNEFPMNRLGTDKEVADVACFLLSERASWVNGANVVVDGGQNPPNMVSALPVPGRWRE